jgi:hypothetical protein
VSELSSQTASGTINLCASGSGALTWKASWDKANAPWLSLNSIGGTVMAPNASAASITATASAATLKAGTYTATITFTGVQSSSTQAVTVTFTVQGYCINPTTQSLGFTGVAGVSNPTATQVARFTNCGIKSDWSANVTSGSSWLSINSTSGTLANGVSGSLVVTAANLPANLTGGPYIGTIVVTIGSQTDTITVTLTVKPGLTVTFGTTTYTTSGTIALTSCSTDHVCSFGLTNKSSSATLTWSATYTPATVTGFFHSNYGNPLTPGVTGDLTFAERGCSSGTTITLNISGPANTVLIYITC